MTSSYWWFYDTTAWLPLSNSMPGVSRAALSTCFYISVVNRDPAGNRTRDLRRPKQTLYRLGHRRGSAVHCSGISGFRVLKAFQIRRKYSGPSELKHCNRDSKIKFKGQRSKILQRVKQRDIINISWYLVAQRPCICVKSYFLRITRPTSYFSPQNQRPQVLLRIKFMSADIFLILGW